MPDPPGFDDASVKNLGRGVAAHFAGLYPLASLDLIDRLRGLIEHYGSGRRAAAAVGVSASTLRRWARGTTPKPESRRKADRAYLNIHLDLHHFNPANTFEARMASAFSAGQG